MEDSRYLDRPKLKKALDEMTPAQRQIVVGAANGLKPETREKYLKLVEHGHRPIPYHEAEA